MHLGLESLLDFYRSHQNDDALVLGTIVATEGSTYRKTGAMMLIAQDGSHRGLISGGCLESDLAQHAQQVFTTREPHIVSYDLAAGDDLIWGLGIGCEGEIHLLLQPLEQHDGFGFLSALEQLLKARRASWFSLVTKSTDNNIPMGSVALKSDDILVGNSELLLYDASQTSSDATPLRSIDLSPTDTGQRFYQHNIKTSAGELVLLQLRILPPPALLICGAGIDTLPLARLATELGWYCHIVDHRTGFADPARFPSTCVVQQLQPASMSSQIDLTRIDAVVIMSHNLEHDRSYLKSLVNPDSMASKEQQPAFTGQYIGLLGPRTRRDKLINDVGVNTEKVPFIYGPAGLDIGAELPESIALSIIAEIHAVLNRRQGGKLSPQRLDDHSPVPGTQVD